MEEHARLFDCIVAGDAKGARALTEAALANKVDPNLLLNEQMIPAMRDVGKRFEAGEYFVPDLLTSARAMKASLELLRPLLASGGAKPLGRVAIGTVKGDLHDIGKNLVAAMLEGGGFEVIDLGADVPAERIIETIRTQHVNLVAISALLTTTMASMKSVIDDIIRAGLRNEVKIIVGGAPLTQKFADQIGADGFSDNANGAVELSRRLLGAA